MNAKLTEKTTERIYVNNVFGKKINAYVGPVYKNNLRSVYAQGSVNGRFYETGAVNIETGEIIASGEQNIADTKKVLGAL